MNKRKKYIIIAIVSCVILWWLLACIMVIFRSNSAPDYVDEMVNNMGEQAIEYLNEQLNAEGNISEHEKIIVDSYRYYGYDASIESDNANKSDFNKVCPYQTIDVTLIVTENTFFRLFSRKYVVSFERNQNGVMEINKSFQT